MNWWRAHHGIANDSKLAVVANRAKVRRHEVLAVWIACLDYASQNEDRGSVVGLDAEQITAMTDVPEETVRAIMAAFRDRQMISEEGILTSWNKRQPLREREDGNATERKRRSRNSHTMSHHVTPCHAQIRGDEIRGEETTTTALVVEMPRLTEYPKTDAAVRRCFATADLKIVTQIIQAATQAYLSVDSPKIPVMGDADFAAAVEQAWSESSNQTSAALFKSTVPAVVRTWCLHGRHPPAARHGKITVADSVNQLIAERIAKGQPPL